MDCLFDFCLACDKQTTDALYCSQACRLADLERSGPSSPTSPTASQTFIWAAPSTATPTVAATSTSTPHLHKTLTPSSSRSSLISAASFSTPTSVVSPISEKARHQLQDYVSSFDQTREIKRRSLSSSTVSGSF